MTIGLIAASKMERDQQHPHSRIIVEYQIPNKQNKNGYATRASS